MRTRLAAAFAAGIVATLTLTGASAQPPPWRLVQGPDGALFVMRGDVKNRVIPATMTEADMAVAEGPTWADGVMAADGEAAPSVEAPAPPIPAAPPTIGAPRRIGETSVLEGPSGLAVAFTVNALQDNVPAPDRYSRPTGRFVIVEWTVKNEGTGEVDIRRSEFKLQTAEGYLIEYSVDTAREPELETATLGPGQMARGWLTYDVPTGAQIRSLIYQPRGQRQWVIAELP